MVIDTTENPGLWLLAILLLFSFGALFAWWAADKITTFERRIRRNRR